MSAVGYDAVSNRPRKIQVLNEIVKVLREHLDQREERIGGLENQIYLSKEKIKSLEDKLSTDDALIQAIENPTTSVRTIGRDVNLQSRNTNEEPFDEIDGYRLPKSSATVYSRRPDTWDKPYYCLNREESLASQFPFYDSHQTHSLECITFENPALKNSEEELREKMIELDKLKSSMSGSEKAEMETSRTDKQPLRIDEDRSVLDLKADNNIIQKKLHRMQEISSENLLLHSDLADYQVELRDLREETRELRMRCYDLTEENRTNDGEIRDLRRFIELLKANSTGDSGKDLLNKIEFYQMEHDRMMEEIQRLKLRLGEISPRNVPAENSTQQLAEYTGSPTYEAHASENDELPQPAERACSPVVNALAASMASSFAAGRLNKDRSLSPNAALNFRDLTMDRYNKHMEEFNSSESVLNDSSEPLPPHHDGSSNVDGHVYNRPAPDARTSPNAVTFDGTASSESRYSSRHCSTPQHHRNKKSQKSPMTSLPRRAFAPRSPADLSVGYFIKFTRPGGKLSKGVVRYVGHLPTKDEIHIGVELDGFDGRCSGDFDGRKYFACPSNKGFFTPFSKVIMAWE